MTKEEFVVNMIKGVEKTALQSIDQKYSNPQFKWPSSESRELGEWYQRLDDEERCRIEKLAAETASFALYAVLAMLDGLAFLENTPEKGELLLYYEKNGQKVLINDPHEADLTAYYYQIKNNQS